jgi:DNA repair/transcription protein MET18/MMS19
MDGEKDPRNLLLAFSLVKIIICEFDISQHVEVSNIYLIKHLLHL